MKIKLLLAACSLIALSDLSTASTVVGWSEWLNRDNPYGSDAETLPAFLQSGAYPSLCTNPTAIEARFNNGSGYQVIAPGATSASPDKIRTFSARDGLQCYSSDQLNSRLCADYEVRFYCNGGRMDLSNVYPFLRQVDAENAAYNLTVPAFQGNHPVDPPRTPTTDQGVRTDGTIVASDFRMGQGFDPLTSRYRSQCLDPDKFHINEDTSDNSAWYSTEEAVTNESLYQLLDTDTTLGASGAFTIKGVSVTYGADFNSKRVKKEFVDKSNIVYVAQYTNLAKHYSMTVEPNAVKNSITGAFLRNTYDKSLQAAFYNNCGDRFVDNVDLGGRLYMVFHFDSKRIKTSDITTAKLTVKAAIAKIFNGSASQTSINEAINTFNAYSVKVEAFQLGGPKDLASINISSANFSAIPQYIRHFEQGINNKINLAAISESYRQYDLPPAYASDNRDAVFLNVSTPLNHLKKYISLGNQWTGACGQLFGYNNLLGANFNTTHCAARTGWPDLETAIDNCAFPPNWGSCVHPNTYTRSDGSNLLFTFMEGAPALSKYNRDGDSVHYSTTSRNTCGTVHATVFLPSNCFEDKYEAGNATGHVVLEEYFKSPGNGSGRYYTNSFYWKGYNRWVDARATVCTRATFNNGAEAKVKIAIRAYGVCATTNSFPL